MWMLPETTCALLVFCMPALPKAFGEQSIVRKFAQSIRSWTRLVTSRNRKHSQSNFLDLPESGKYRRVWENGQVMKLNKLQRPSAIHSQPLAHDDDTSNKQESHFGGPSELGILRATEADQFRYPASIVSGRSLKERQHPWMQQ